MKIQIKVLNKEFYRYEDFVNIYCNILKYATDGSCAVDLMCTEDTTICPQGRVKIHTGLAIYINSNHTAGIILPRSGLGAKGLVLANTIGLIDSDYTGELMIAAWNNLTLHDDSKYIDSIKYNDYNTIHIKAGDRIAQLMFIPIIKTEFEIVEEFKSNTVRGNGGFGSTGC